MTDYQKAMLFRVGIFGPVLLSFLIALSPDARQQLQDLVQPDRREVLASLTNRLDSGGPLFKIVKIKQRSNILVEIYEVGSDEKRLERFQTLSLEDQADAYANFNGQVTNLALDDIDRDSILEILVPTYTINRTSNLNIIKYAPDSQTFFVQSQ